MNRQLVLRRLWWKELRQLWPLVAMLLGLGAVLQIFFAMATNIDSQFVFLGLPGLFAVGAGALLVGQEKELRTVQWLSSLPIAARDIVCTKLCVGAIGLLLVWLVSLLLVLLIGKPPAAAYNSFSGHSLINDGVGWGLHSVFLLFLGYATAWKIRSTFVSLLVLVPLAFLPVITASIHSWLWGSRAISPMLEFYLALYAVAFLWGGWIAGVRFLNPHAAPRSMLGATPRAEAQGRVNSLQSERAVPFTALLWQFAAQNKAALGGLGLLFLLSSICLRLPELFSGLVGGLAAIAGFLACSWLGLLVFQSDAVERRVMFLADRGVGPGKTWCTRQLIPLASLTIGVSVMLLMMPENVRQVDAMLVIALAIFAASQWFGQLVRSTIVGAILAPAFSVLVVTYSIFAIDSLLAPRWLVGLSLLVYLLATRVMTSRWMDTRLGQRYWLGHSGFLLLAFGLPLIPFVAFVSTYPSLSPEIRQELKSIADAQSVYTSKPLEFALPNVAGRDTQATQMKWAWVARREWGLKNLDQQLAANPSGIPSNSTVSTILTDTLLTRMHLEQEATAARLSDYRSAVQSIVKITQRMRASHYLPYQDRADDFEMWLLEEVSLPNAQQWLDDDLYRQVVDMLADRQSRNEARRRALAVSWQTAEADNLGGYTLSAEYEHQITSRDLFVFGRRADLVSGALLQLLDAPPLERQRLRNEVNRLMGRSSTNDIPAAPYIAGADGQPELLYAELQGQSMLGANWNAEWEYEAVKLKDHPAHHASE